MRKINKERRKKKTRINVICSESIIRHMRINKMRTKKNGDKMKKKKKINFEYEINTHIRLCLFSNVKGDFFSYTFLLVNSIINEST